MASIPPIAPAKRTRKGAAVVEASSSSSSSSSVDGAGQQLHRSSPLSALIVTPVIEMQSSSKARGTSRKSRSTVGESEELLGAQEQKPVEELGRGEPSVFAGKDSGSAFREPEVRSLGGSRLPEPTVRHDSADSLSEPFAPQTIRTGLAELADARPYHSTGAQTDVVFDPYEPLPDGNLDTEKMGLDMVRLLRQYAHHHPEVFGYFTKSLELPEYDHNREPWSVVAPTSNWPAPLPPLDVDWGVDSPEVFEYESKVYVFHLVNAAVFKDYLCVTTSKD